MNLDNFSRQRKSFGFQKSNRQIHAPCLTDSKCEKGVLKCTVKKFHHLTTIGTKNKKNGHMFQRPHVKDKQFFFDTSRHEKGDRLYKEEDEG